MSGSDSTGLPGAISTDLSARPDNPAMLPILDFASHPFTRCRGSLLGLAVGDALGTTLEFKSPGTFRPLRDMIGGGPFGLKPGQWTDDTSMALCLGESLLACGGFDARDQMERYCRWWREGHLSATGTCFDIGITVRGALGRFQRDRDPFAGSTDPQTAGNGSLMRLAPVPLFFAQSRDARSRGAGGGEFTHDARGRRGGGCLAGTWRH